MPRRARIHFVSLRSSLVNLPISIYGPLLERSIRPQNLAVHLTLIPTPQHLHGKVEAYVGWTGMASASSLAHFNLSDSGEKVLETVEIDPQYAQGLGLSQGDMVEIGLLHDLPLAKSVATEPLTPDDWEIIEIHSSHVESTLLSQVRVARMNQELDVWVMGRTRVRLRVVNLDPQSKGNALLLTTNTEVSIAPKPHQSRPSRNSDIPVEGESSTDDRITQAGNNKEHPIEINSQILRVLPLHVLHVPIPEYVGAETLAFVSPSTFSRFHLALKHSNKKGDISCFKASIKLLPSPSDPSSPPLPLSDPGLTTRVIKPGAKDHNNASSDDGHDTKINHIFVGPLNGLPESHVVFPVASNEVREWDIVKLSLTPGIDHINVQSTPAEAPTTILSTSGPRNLLAGVDDILKRCTEFCIRNIFIHASTKVVHGVSTLLLTGRTGAGKTSIVQSVAKSIQEDARTLTFTHFIDVSQYSEQPIPAIKALFQYWFAKAAWHRPSILILDNLDKLLGAELEHTDSFRTRLVTELFLSAYSSSARTIMPNTRGIILIATAISTNTLHPLLNTTHVFQDVVALKPPNKDARRDILAKIVGDRLDMARDVNQDPDSPLNFTALATQTEGYSATDLQDLVSRAMHQVAIRVSKNKTPPLLSFADFAAAQVDFVPLSLRDVKLQKSDVAWSDIGGLRETRRVLRETLEWPTKYGPIFSQSPLRLRSGLLLYGFPGCGKTLLASAVAKECGLNFISVKGPEILNKYIGASEKSIRDLFERASAAKPCVLFFDEFDSIAPKRGHDSTGVTDRVVNQMLTQMDGAEGLDGVYVLAATSRPDLIDSALIRPGRLDKSLFCGMPDLEEREDILRAVGGKVPISSSVDFRAIAAATDGYSGADLQALVYNAHLEVVHASIADTSATNQSQDVISIEFTSFGGPPAKTIASKAEKMALEAKLRQIKSTSPIYNEKDIVKLESPAPTKPQHVITTDHIRHVLKTTRPSVSPAERARLDRIYRSFLLDRNGDLPAPEGAGGVGNRVSLM